MFLRADALPGPQDSPLASVTLGPYPCLLWTPGPLELTPEPGPQPSRPPYSGAHRPALARAA